MSLSTKNKILATPVCTAILLLFVLLVPMMGEAKAADYALQIAAMRSQQNAVDLARGLRAQGIDAYWIEKDIPAQGMFYRVRIGKFRTIDKAYGYAESLVDSGIFETYAIAAYEAPTRATMLALQKEKEDPKATNSEDKLQAFFSPSGDFANLASTVASPPLRELSPEPPAIVPVTMPANMEAPSRPAPSGRLTSTTIDMVASIGTRGWLLLSSDEVISATTRNPTTIGREVAKLAAAIGSRRWTLGSDISKILTTVSPVAPAPEASLEASAKASKEAVAAVNLADLATRDAAEQIAQQEARIAAASTPMAAPGIGRGPSSPTSSSPVLPGASPVNYLAPPKLQGSIEQRDGAVWVKLRNLDGGRSFSGTARITLSSSKDLQDAAPLAVAVPAGQEISVQVSDARVLDGDWMMMVYDQGGVARLIRGASFGQAPAAPPAAEDKPQAAPAAAPAGPPSYVTGSFDATGGWQLTESGGTQPQPNQIAPPEQPMPAAPQPVPQGEIPDPDGNPRTAANPPQEEALPQVSVTPRQIATTAQSVTLEFEISSSKPLNYVVVSVRAGSYQDSRQALMSTPQGRVPFMIPISQSNGAYSFEVKNESGSTLASGAGEFSQSKK